MSEPQSVYFFLHLNPTENQAQRIFFEKSLPKHLQIPKLVVPLQRNRER